MPTITLLPGAIQSGRRDRSANLVAVGEVCREFRSYLHDPAAMVGVLEGTGLRLVMEHHGPMWSIAGFERQAP